MLKKEASKFMYGRLSVKMPIGTSSTQVSCTKLTDFLLVNAILLGCQAGTENYELTGLGLCVSNSRILRLGPTVHMGVKSRKYYHGPFFTNMFIFMDRNNVRRSFPYKYYQHQILVHDNCILSKQLISYVECMHKYCQFIVTKKLQENYLMLVVKLGCGAHELIGDQLICFALYGLHWYPTAFHRTCPSQ